MVLVENVGDKDISLNWGSFQYKVVAGKEEAVPVSVANALRKRYKDSIVVKHKHLNSRQLAEWHASGSFNVEEPASEEAPIDVDPVGEDDESDNIGNQVEAPAVVLDVDAGEDNSVENVPSEPKEAPKAPKNAPKNPKNKGNNKK